MNSCERSRTQHRANIITGLRLKNLAKGLARRTRTLRRSLRGCSGKAFAWKKSRPGGRSIVFSGDAGHLRSAFQTEIHKYAVNGKLHWANAQEPRVPAELAPLIAGIASLNNFEAKPQVHVFGTAALSLAHAAKPEAILGNGSHALSPADYSVIYNSKPLLNSGVNGTGRTIAVIGRSNINVSDIADFRSLLGLPAKNPTIIVNGTNPGNLGGNEEIEAVLDTTWAGAVAPQASIRFVVSASTNSTDGVFLSALYAINHNVGDVMTESFGTCEATYTQSGANYLATLAQQAAGQGISYMVSAGDSGAAGCDSPTSSPEKQGLSVNVLGSTPYTTTVGGTQFNEGGIASYWASGNGSATSYIPENVWNESCAVNSCSSPNLYAGGGGVSIYFTRPSWQTGVPGLPQGGFRDVPDISLTAASGHDPYILCVEGSCAGSSPSVYLVGGTSASAPSFAGIMALVDQKNGGRQGNANPNLYRLAAQQTYSNCNGSRAGTAPGSSCVFNDITVGNNAVPGESGYGSTSGAYQSGTGYDLATGLGSVNATNLANAWSSAFPGVPGTTYFRIIGTESGRAIELAAGNSAAGASVDLWNSSKALYQEWQFMPVGSGLYKIVNRLTGYVLDDAGASKTANNFILDEPWTSAPEQIWFVYSVDGQSYRILNQLSGLSLKAHWGGRANGTLLVQADWDNLTDMEWRLVPAQ